MRAGEEITDGMRKPPSSDSVFLPVKGQASAKRSPPLSLVTATFRGADWLTGGKLGPEASLLVFPVIAAMFFAFHILYRAPAETSGLPAL